MPNWCDNSLTVSHPDEEMMKKFSEAIKNGNLFATFIPYPKGEWDYGWCVENWGTKWDCCDGDFYLDEGNNSGSGWFNTAWGPPIAAYHSLKDLGFIIDAFYHECGIGFCGIWEDGKEECVENYYTLFEDWESEQTKNKLLSYNEDLRIFLRDEYSSWVESKREESEE